MIDNVNSSQILCLHSCCSFSLQLKATLKVGMPTAWQVSGHRVHAGLLSRPCISLTLLVVGVRVSESCSSGSLSSSMGVEAATAAVKELT